MKKIILEMTHSLAELCVLADIPMRTARYYVQVGLIDHPVGETRAARYGPSHLEQLLLVKKWAAAGVSLERIRELIQGGTPSLPALRHVAGSVVVRSHLTVADGIEVVIEPGRAGLTPEQVRAFIQGVMAAFGEATKASAPGRGTRTHAG